MRLLYKWLVVAFFIMGESFEARQKRLRAERERDARLRQKKAKAAHQKQVEAFFGEKNFTPKQQVSLEQTLQYAPVLPENAWRVLFQQMAQAYFGMLYAQQRGGHAPVLSYNLRQIPMNWADYFRDVFRDNHVRASSAINFFGICQKKTLLERVEEKTKFFQFGERPRALRHGTDMHKRMEEAERAVAEFYVGQGCSVSYDKEALLSYAGLAFVQEAAFDSAFDVRGHRVKLSGHPDRVLSAGRTAFVLEAKTNLMKFSPHMIAGAVIQDLFYGLLVSQFTDRPVVLGLTESAKPLERGELDYLASGNEGGFVNALLRSGKVGMLVPFTPEHRGLALYFLEQMVSVLYNPVSASGAEKSVCDRYECPFRSRGCEFYTRESIR